LTSITIPSSVLSLGDSPFVGCTSLVSIIVDDNNPSYTDIDGVLFNSDGTKLLQYPCGHSHRYTVPDNVTSIAEYSFYKCSGLLSVTIPSSVTEIGEGAFNTVNMAYVNYLGSSEPVCPGITNTFVVVDVVCVPLDYKKDSFCGAYTVRVSSCEEFVAQQNQCYEVLEWQAEEITVMKRANATLWEKKTNNCFEYQCSNTSGGVAWSLCNTTDDTRRICLDNKCIEENEDLNKDKWGVEMIVNIAPSDFDIENVTYILSNATGILQVEMSIGTEATQRTGFVVRVVVYVNDQQNANTILNAMENRGEGDDCKYGVLCTARSVRLLKEEEGLVVSSASAVHVNILFESLMLFLLAAVFVKK